VIGKEFCMFVLANTGSDTTHLFDVLEIVALSFGLLGAFFSAYDFVSANRPKTDTRVRHFLQVAAPALLGALVSVAWVAVVAIAVYLIVPSRLLPVDFVPAIAMDLVGVGYFGIRFGALVGLLNALYITARTRIPDWGVVLWALVLILLFGIRSAIDLVISALTLPKVFLLSPGEYLQAMTPYEIAGDVTLCVSTVAVVLYANRFLRWRVQSRTDLPTFYWGGALFGVVALIIVAIAGALIFPISLYLLYLAQGDITDFLTDLPANATGTLVLNLLLFLPAALLVGGFAPRFVYWLKGSASEHQFHVLGLILIALAFSIQLVQPIAGIAH
jgi:hypothetical protein